MTEITDDFEREEMLGYLLNEGHSKEDAEAALSRWARDHLIEVRAHTFRLTLAGIEAVKELRGSGPRR